MIKVKKMWEKILCGRLCEIVIVRLQVAPFTPFPLLKAKICSASILQVRFKIVWPPGWKQIRVERCLHGHRPHCWHLCHRPLICRMRPLPWCTHWSAREHGQLHCWLGTPSPLLCMLPVTRGSHWRLQEGTKFLCMRAVYGGTKVFWAQGFSHDRSFGLLPVCYLSLSLWCDTPDSATRLSATNSNLWFAKFCHTARFLTGVCRLGICVQLIWTSKSSPSGRKLLSVEAISVHLVEKWQTNVGFGHVCLWTVNWWCKCG